MSLQLVAAGVSAFAGVLACSGNVEGSVCQSRSMSVMTPGLVNGVQTLASKIFPRALVIRAARTMTKLGRVAT